MARIGGRELRVVAYRVRVAERFKGAVKRAKDGQYVDVRMLAGFDARADAMPRGAFRAPELPSVERGEEYLLFVSAPSAAGLSTTIGLGQGKYRITRAGGRESAVNDFENRALFRGMKGQPTPSHGPIAYAQLSERIRRLVGAGGR